MTTRTYQDRATFVLIVYIFEWQRWRRTQCQGKLPKTGRLAAGLCSPWYGVAKRKNWNGGLIFAIGGGASAFFFLTSKFASRLRHATIPTMWHILQHQNPTALPPRYAFDTAMTCFQINFEQPKGFTGTLKPDYMVSRGHKSPMTYSWTSEQCSIDFIKFLIVQQFWHYTGYICRQSSVYTISSLPIAMIYIRDLTH